jgi:glutamate racemase
MNRPIVFFDSGIGGLSVLREARILMPERQFIYIADDLGFPYGAWEENALKNHVVTLFERFIEQYNPILCVIACNTASTIVMETLRAHFPNMPFVGTVPAIKPASERTRSGLISVLATPGTVKRQYTRDLIEKYADKVQVHLVASEKLANLAEIYMREGFVNEDEVAFETAPCFIEKGEKRTDIIVLACTHYPFLVNRMRKTAPWPVDWIDPAEAIARRALSVLNERTVLKYQIEPILLDDLAVFTSNAPDFSYVRLMSGFGLKV